MTEAANPTPPMETDHLKMLAEEAAALARMLGDLQDHLALIPPEAFPAELKISGQALDHGEQGLQDFAAIFHALASKSLPISQAALQDALTRTGQHRLRWQEDMAERPGEPKDDGGDVEFF